MLDVRFDGRVRKGIFERTGILDDDVAIGRSEGAYDSPTCAVDHDLGANSSLGQALPDPASLANRREAVLTEAIAQQSAESRLASAVSYRLRSRDTGVRGPDDVQAGAKGNVPNYLFRFPDGQPAHP